MKTNYLLAALAFLFAFTAFADPIVLPQYGFQIDPLDLPSGDRPTQALSTFLPERNGFAPNVVVVIQPFSNAVDGFITLSKKQIDQIHGTIINQKKISSHEWSVEYTATMRKETYHLYARAILKNGKAYVATATARDADWPADAEILRHCVESMTADLSAP